MKITLFTGMEKGIRLTLQSNRTFRRNILPVQPDAKGTSYGSKPAANSLDETGRLLPGLIHASRT